MPRDIKKLKELEKIIQNKDLELGKYKQLITSIQGLITINGIKLDEEAHAELFASQRQGGIKDWYGIYDNVKNQAEKLTAEEQTEALFKRLKAEGLQLIVNGNQVILARRDDKETQEAINKYKKPKEKEPQKCINCQELGKWESSFCPNCLASETKQDYKDDYDDEIEEVKIPPKTHVDELKELEKQGKLKPSEIVKQKRKGRHEALEGLSEKAQETTATKQFLTEEERIAKLPPEAQAQIRANKARAAAAAREENKPTHGEVGDAEYERLTRKEKREKGEIPTDGTCSHCKEQLEAPIVRGLHKECYEAKAKKEALTEK